ncbi:MAG: hypothetical protein ACOCRU_01185 [bacterium]
MQNLIYLLAESIGATVIPFLIVYIVLRVGKQKNIRGKYIFYSFILSIISFASVILFFNLNNSTIYAVIAFVFPVVFLNYFVKY